jgi:uncharacterized SAM-binding protein YcdF (DUF218 family)
MDSVRAVTKALIPGSVEFFALGLAVGLLLLFVRGRVARWGRGWLAVLVVTYLVLSLQGTSDLLLWGLNRGYRSISTVGDAGGARLIVVLSDGAKDPESGPTRSVVNMQSGFNAREGARLYRLIGDPLVLASGGWPPGIREGPPESHPLSVALQEFGVPADRIVEESTSRTTREQAVNVSRWLREHGEARFILVTSPDHMRRSAGAFRALGFNPVVSPSGLRYSDGPVWLPSFSALLGSRHSIYEYLALGLYRLRGWV